MAVLKARIERMIGPRGKFIKLSGENKDGEALARLMITDVVAAETIDMHGLLDKPLGSVAQDPGVDPGEVRANVLYTLARTSESLRLGTTLEVNTLKIGAIDIEIGPGVRLGASVPAVRLSVEVLGSAKLKLGPATIADASVRGGKLEMEVGLKLSADGTPQVAVWVPDSPFDIDVHWAVIVALGLLNPLIALGAAGVGEILERVVNGKVASSARDLFADPEMAPAS